MTVGPQQEPVPDIVASADGAPQPAVATVANAEGDEMDGALCHALFANAQPPLAWPICAPA